MYTRDQTNLQKTSLGLENEDFHAYFTRLKACFEGESVSVVVDSEKKLTLTIATEVNDKQVGYIFKLFDYSDEYLMEHCMLTNTRFSDRLSRLVFDIAAYCKSVPNQ